MYVTRLNGRFVKDDASQVRVPIYHVHSVHKKANQTFSILSVQCEDDATFV